MDTLLDFIGVIAFALGGLALFCGQPAWAAAFMLMHVSRQLTNIIEYNKNLNDKTVNAE